MSRPNIDISDDNLDNIRQIQAAVQSLTRQVDQADAHIGQTISRSFSQIREQAGSFSAQMGEISFTGNMSSLNDTLFQVEQTTEGCKLRFEEFREEISQMTIRSEEYTGAMEEQMTLAGSSATAQMELRAEMESYTTALSSAMTSAETVLGVQQELNEALDVCPVSDIDIQIQGMIGTMGGWLGQISVVGSQWSVTLGAMQGGFSRFGISVTASFSAVVNTVTAGLNKIKSLWSWIKGEKVEQKVDAISGASLSAAAGAVTGAIADVSGTQSQLLNARASVTGAASGAISGAVSPKSDPKPGVSGGKVKKTSFKQKQTVIEVEMSEEKSGNLRASSLYTAIASGLDPLKTAALAAAATVPLIIETPSVPELPDPNIYEQPAVVAENNSSDKEKSRKQEKPEKSPKTEKEGKEEKSEKSSEDDSSGLAASAKTYVSDMLGWVKDTGALMGIGQGSEGEGSPGFVNWVKQTAKRGSETSKAVSDITKLFKGDDEIQKKVGSVGIGELAGLFGRKSPEEGEDAVDRLSSLGFSSLSDVFKLVTGNPLGEGEKDENRNFFSRVKESGLSDASTWAKLITGKALGGDISEEDGPANFLQRLTSSGFSDASNLLKLITGNSLGNGEKDENRNFFKRLTASGFSDVSKLTELIAGKPLGGEIGEDGPANFLQRLTSSGLTDASNILKVITGKPLGGGEAEDMEGKNLFERLSSFGLSNVSDVAGMITGKESLGGEGKNNLLNWIGSAPLDTISDAVKLFGGKSLLGKDADGNAKKSGLSGWTDSAQLSYLADTVSLFTKNPVFGSEGYEGKGAKIAEKIASVSVSDVKDVVQAGKDAFGKREDGEKRNLIDTAKSIGSFGSKVFGIFNKKGKSKDKIAAATESPDIESPEEMAGELQAATGSPALSTGGFAGNAPQVPLWPEMPALTTPDLLPEVPMENLPDAAELLGIPDGLTDDTADMLADPGFSADSGLGLATRMPAQDGMLAGMDEESSYGQQGGQAIAMSKFCDTLEIHIANADDKGYQQIESEITNVLKRVFDNYEA